MCNNYICLMEIAKWNKSGMSTLQWKKAVYNACLTNSIIKADDVFNALIKLEVDAWNEVFFDEMQGIYLQKH